MRYRDAHVTGTCCGLVHGFLAKDTREFSPASSFSAPPTSMCHVMIKPRIYSTLVYAHTESPPLNHCLLREHQLRPNLPTAHLSQPMSHLDRLIQVLAQRKCTHEPTGKHIPRTVRVDNFLAGKLGNGVRLWVLVGRSEIGR